MSDEIKRTVEESLEEIFYKVSEVDTFEVTLPSLGKGYKNTKKVLTIRPMTFEDEKYIATHPTKNILEDLLDRCVVDVDKDELYLEDKLFLYYKIRECSFGSSAKVTTSCSFCDTVNELEIDLTQLQVDYAPEEFTNPREVFLPTLQKTILLLKLQSFNQDYAKTQDQLLDNLWRFIPKMDTCEDPVVISKAIKKLSSADIRTITNKINDSDFGLDTRAKYVCNSCRKEDIATVGLSLDFFMMS